MTVDTSRLVVSEGMNREMLYVGATRGREENTVHAVTGPPDPAGMTRAEREAYADEALRQAGERLRQGDRAGALAVPDPRTGPGCGAGHRGRPCSPGPWPGMTRN